jgi:ankyrin repeat protein
MPNYIKTSRGYFYKVYKNGERKRVSLEEYNKKNKMKGGLGNNSNILNNNNNNTVAGKVKQNNPSIGINYKLGMRQRHVHSGLVDQIDTLNSTNRDNYIKGYSNVINRILNNSGKNIENKTKIFKELLLNASYKDDFQILSLLLDKTKLKPNVCDENGDTLLIIASYKGNTEIVRLLLENGANPNKVNRYKYTALSLASQNGHIEIVRLLLDKKADPNIPKQQGPTPLILASVNRHIEIVRLLLEKGADVNMRDNDGLTALILASAKGYINIVRLLLEKKANPDIQGNYNKIRDCTALIIACRLGYEKIVNLLLINGANLNKRSSLEPGVFSSGNDAGPSPLEHTLLAKPKNYKVIIQLLLKYGANPEVKIKINNNNRDYISEIKNKNIGNIIKYN